MNLKSGFFNSVNGDRIYNADDMCKPYNRIVSDGVMAAGNGRLSTDYQVTAGGDLNLIIKQGFGIFNNRWAELEDNVFITVPTPNVLYPRIDSVIVRADEGARTVSLEYLQGSPAQNPVAPSLTRTTALKEYRLANIYVAANTVSIDQSQITDTRPLSECGFISNLLWNSDITATYAQWEHQFKNWFDDVRAELVSATAMVSLSNEYTTTKQDEVDIPINIPRYSSGTDILQVYINGLICIPGIDYTITDYTSIKLKNGVDTGTLISFIVYKSVDTQESETVITQVNELYERVEKLEGKNEALWIGASALGTGESIMPSKKLSECNEGYILCWTNFNPSTGTSSDARFNFTYVPKKLLRDISTDRIDVVENIVHALGTDGTIEMAAKRFYVFDDKIEGYSGNTAGNYNKNIALRAIYEY